MIHYRNNEDLDIAVYNAPYNVDLDSTKLPDIDEELYSMSNTSQPVYTSDNSSIDLPDSSNDSMKVAISNIGRNITNSGTGAVSNSYSTVTEGGNTLGNNDNSSNNSNDFEASTLALLRRSEGKYDTVKDIGDGAGISAGAYQFTDKVGDLNILLKRLGVNVPKSMPYKQRVAIIKRAINTPKGRAMQDELAKEKYVKPVLSKAKRLGIKDPKAIQFLIDTHLNGGLNSVIRRAIKKGGLTLDNLKAARKDRYQYLARTKPKLRKFLHGWLARVDRF